MAIAKDHAWSESGLLRSRVEESAARRRAEELRWPELLLFALFPLETIPLPGFDLPLNESAAVLVVLIALTRRPDRDLKIPAWFLGLVSLLVLTLLYSSYINGLAPVRRLGHVGIVVLLSVIIASGRVHARSAGFGLLGGLGIAGGWGLLTFGQSAYVGRLTGLFGDPNVAGMLLVVYGAVSLAFIRTWAIRIPVILVLSFLVMQTYSRTSWLSAAILVLWLVVGRRLSPTFGAILLGGLIWATESVPQEWKQTGQFAQRAGSDELRARIEAQEMVDVAQAPVFGNGAGSAMVDINGDLFFYHSSYLAIRAEGGYVAMVVLITLVVGVFLAAHRLPFDKRAPWLEGGVIAAMVCAMNIGEALLAFPLWIALGLTMRHVLTVKASASPPSEESSSITAIGSPGRP
ncbi:O-antigen ligase family protein [Janibacter sp. GXQ6167]|uniref:O-antigen ligase family protein n=1 Tax=Janibacter sp. GXQ6167 TaxID=3240791 RepID=UPI0035260769